MANRMDFGYLKYREEYINKVTQILDAGRYILGEEVSSFEDEFAEYVGAN